MIYVKTDVFFSLGKDPSNTWSRHMLGLACVLMLRPISPRLIMFPDFWISNILGSYVFIIFRHVILCNTHFSSSSLLNLAQNKVKKAYLKPVSRDVVYSLFEWFTGWLKSGIRGRKDEITKLHTGIISLDIQPKLIPCHCCVVLAYQFL